MSPFKKRGAFGGRAGSSAHGGGGHGGGLNLTPMIDMLVILLVFLIKNYSTDPAFLTPTQGIDLAKTESEQAAQNQAVVIVGKDGIIVDGKMVVPFKQGKMDPALARAADIPELSQVLTKLADKTKFIAEKNTSVKFTGTLILQADKSVPFDSLRPILRTAGKVGYNDIKFAGVFAE
jgi:biopolymer transport protein ExbD